MFVAIFVLFSLFLFPILPPSSNILLSKFIVPSFNWMCQSPSIRRKCFLLFSAVSFYNLALCLNSIYSLASCFILQPATNVAVYNLPLCIFKNSFLVISFHRYYAVKLCSAIPHLYNSLDLLLSAYHVTPLLYCSAFT